MDATAVFTEAFGRLPDLVGAAVDDLDTADLAHRPDADANSIAWLIWHLSRVQDDHLAGAAGVIGHNDLSEQVWTAQGFAGRFGLPFDDSAVGYGQSSAEVAAVRAPAELLREYHAAVHDRTGSILSRFAADDWDVVVDESWNPPVTLAVRVSSVLGDVLQHVGQAAYVRGLVERRGGVDTLKA